MVKFGRHQKFFLENEHPSTYVVPYNEAKTNIEENHISEEDFEAQWRAYLKHAREDFDTSLRQLWRQVFSALNRHDVEEGRGAPPEKALVLFSQHAPGKEVQEVLSAFKSLHATALMNAEALRKLVKKFDKKHKQKLEQGSNVLENKEEKSGENPTTKSLSLSCKLLPEVYAANFVIGLAALQQGIELLRAELGIGDLAHHEPVPPQHPVPSHQPDSHNGGFMPTETHASSWSIGMNIDHDHSEQDMQAPVNNNAVNHTAPDNTRHQDRPFAEHAFSMLSKNDRKDSHAEHIALVDRRRQELLWLKRSVDRLEQIRLLSHLVAHRGFHSPMDRSDLRPLENSLQAYESAWTSGIHLCECDIALTKDEHLILAHDKDFSRLALDSDCEKSSRDVRDLTFQEIMTVALKSGSRPPLLLDILQSAHAIGGHSQLIIEIKPGNREAASALARMFQVNPHLMARCAVVMSFDSFVMHSMHDEMDAIFGSEGKEENPGGHRRCFSMGMFPVPSLTGMDGPHIPHATKYPRPKLLILTVSDAPKRDEELQVSISEKNCLETIHGWTKGRLDGVYMQFEPKMTTPEGSEAVRKLARQVYVGVWGYNGKDPDHYDTFRSLVQEGNSSFVNTDLPRDFFQESPAPCN